jgi:NADH dehydrogenase FAD-containing subunit
VVERRDAVHHKIGAIRASVRGGEWTDRVRIPLNRVIKHGKTVIGDVIEVDPEAKVLKFTDAATAPLKYDILIAATGTVNHSPGDLPNSVVTKDDVRKYFRHTSNAIRDAKNVLIVGGGASAVECQFLCVSYSRQYSFLKQTRARSATPTPTSPSPFCAPRRTC